MYLRNLAIAGLALAAAAVFVQAQNTPRAHSITARPVASKRGWLGVGLVELTPERAKALRLNGEQGLEVTHIEGDSPAARAGLKLNDVILEVNDQKVEDGGQFAATIGETAPGTKVNLTVWRNGAKQTMAATLEARPMQLFAMPAMPSMPPMPPSPFDDDNFSILPGQSPRVGFEGETLTPQLAEYFGVKEGVLVRTVVAHSPAEKAGLKAGDVVTKVAGTPVSSPREISGLVRAGRGHVTFTVVRNHKEITLNVEIAEDLTADPDREAL